MCLSKVEQVFEPPLAEMEGWKVFRWERGRLYPVIYAPDGDDVRYCSCGYVAPIPTGVWLKAVQVEEEVDREWGDGKLPQCYLTGFHVCLTAHDAMELMRSLGWGHLPLEAVQVRVRGVRLQGRQKQAEVWVADEMMVPRQPQTEGETR